MHFNKTLFDYFVVVNIYLKIDKIVSLSSVVSRFLFPVFIEAHGVLKYKKNAFSYREKEKKSFSRAIVMRQGNNKRLLLWIAL